MKASPPFTIERLQAADDLEEVGALEAACFAAPWSADMRRRELRESEVVRLYALRTPSRRLAGFLACWLIWDELHINTVAIDPERRGQGLARRLVRHALTEAVADGAVRATLEVRRSNAAAIGLYEALGFTIRAVRPDYYANPSEDALILWLDDCRAFALPGTAGGPP